MRLTLSLVYASWGCYMGSTRCQALCRPAASPHSKPRLRGHLLKQKNALVTQLSPNPITRNSGFNLPQSHHVTKCGRLFGGSCLDVFFLRSASSPRTDQAQPAARIVAGLAVSSPETVIAMMVAPAPSSIHATWALTALTAATDDAAGAARARTVSIQASHSGASRHHVASS